MTALTLHVARVDGTVEPLAGAVAGMVARSGLLLTVTDADGCCGQGEASPLPGYSPDTIEQCGAELAGLGPDALRAPEGQPVLEWLDGQLAASGVRSPAARFGLETALLDWLGRRRQRSFAVLIRGDLVPRTELPLSSLVADLASAQAAYTRGVRAFKLKLSPETFDADTALAAALRERFGSDITLRFDANRKLADEGVLQRLAQLSRFDPEFVEEPVADMRALPREGVAVALAADESLAVPGMWPALADRCRAVVLKPTLLGGVGACLRIAQEAAARGLLATVTHTFDGPIALAAAAELALALPGTVLACGLDPHRGLAAWPAVAVPQIQEDRIVSAGAPGLGLPSVTAPNP